MREKPTTLAHGVWAGSMPAQAPFRPRRSEGRPKGRTEASERPDDGSPVIDVDRGGKITWHGPGQLVGYPILRLHNPVDVVAYVRRLEELLIDVIAHFGVTGQRVVGR